MFPADASDDDLVTAATRGDSDAFAMLVMRHEHSARRLAGALIGSSEADDVAQDAFVRAYRSLATFRAGSPFKPWLLRIVVNQAANHRRTSARRERREAFVGRLRWSEPSDPSDIAVTSDDHKRLETALASLPERDRQMLVIRYILDYSEAETADVLGCARGTVKSGTSRALTKLRAHTNSTGLRDRR